MLRTEASSKIGLGHFMRCFALAEAWIESGGSARFVMTETAPATESHLRSIGADAARLTARPGGREDARETVAFAAREGADWIVADGYEFGPEYQQALRAGGQRLLFLDDDGRHPRYEADLVLNQNPHAAETLYPARAGHTRLLLGPRHALLRRQFRDSAPPIRSFPPTARRILVTLGGADPDNVTQLVIGALQALADSDLEVIVLVGASNPRGPQLAAAAAAAPTPITLRHDAKNMPELMAWADLAISAAGSTALELAYIGVPMLLLILADNQAPGAERMHRAGAARSLGWARELSSAALAEAVRQLISAPDERARLARTAQALVDGRGAPRVVRALREKVLRLRPATPDDLRLLFDWANDPEVRAASFDSREIAWSEHERWLRARLASPLAVLLIAETAEHEPVGVARFQIADDVATISISIDAAFRGGGYGRQLIERSSRHMLDQPQVRAVRALIKAENAASTGAFLAAGFREESAPGPHGVRVFLFTHPKP